MILKSQPFSAHGLSSAPKDGKGARILTIAEGMTGLDYCAVFLEAKSKTGGRRHELRVLLGQCSN